MLRFTRKKPTDAYLLARLRMAAPAVHCITGGVSAVFVADVLLAMGARPSLTHDPSEAADMAACADAVLINLATPDDARRKGACVAAQAAAQAGVPWVLDPVLVHASPRRLAFARKLLDLGPAIVKPNAAELAALAPPGGEAAARSLAKQTGATVLLSGETDIVADGAQTLRISGGHHFMDAGVAFGCALGAAAAALLAAGGQPTEAACAAAAIFAEAAQRAERSARGSGSFRIAFLDELNLLRPEDMEARA